MKNFEISSFLPSVDVKKTKFFMIFSKDNKKAYFSGKKLQLQEFNAQFGESFKQITLEEAKRKHLGRIKSIGTIHTKEQLIDVLVKYFSIEIKNSNFSANVNIEIDDISVIASISKNKKNNLSVEENLLKSDENELVARYRASSSEHEKNKIFNTILFERGASGKTWDTIINNYISYNKFKYKHIADYDKNDFYQEIVIALHKEVQKWFNPAENVKFSTYAWYVINSAFHRVLQSLSTQKRKVSYQIDNINLNNQDVPWDEIISSEKTISKKVSFEEEFENKEMCKHIERMFELKEVNISTSLKKDIIDAIKNKFVMRDLFKVLAQKHGVSVEELIKVELVIRNNLQNSIYKDILSFMKYDVNADNGIAKKYNRSKGHIVKMRRQLGQIVRSKMKECVSL